MYDVKDTQISFFKKNLLHQNMEALPEGISWKSYSENSCNGDFLLV